MSDREEALKKVYREYFEYNRKIETAVEAFTAGLVQPVKKMWDFYLKNENCHCSCSCHSVMEQKVFPAW